MGRKNKKNNKKLDLNPPQGIEKHKIKSFILSKTSFWTAALLVAALTLIIYLPALQNDFVNWDDDKFVYENKHIMSVDFEFLKWSFTNRETQWSPLRFFSHAIDYKIWGLNPAGHHLSSIIFHGLNTFLVVVLITVIFETVKSQRLPSPSQEEERRFWRKAFITSIVTGLLFGLHPLRVESVVWVSERKDVLYAFFFLFSLIFYLKYAPPSHNKKRKYYYLLCLLSFIMALMSKAMAVTLPFVLIILDIYPLKRINFESAFKLQRNVLIEKIPFLGLSLASSLIQIGVHEEMGTITPLVTSTLPERLLIACKSLSFYLLKTVWPSNLAPFHPYPAEISFLGFDYIGSFILVITTTIFCISLWNKGNRIWLVIWTYFVITLLPVLGIIRIGAYFAAERYTYMPSIGPFLLIGLGVSLIWEKTYLKDRVFFLNKKFIILSSVLIFSILSVLTVKQIRIWSDSITLWTLELKRYPYSAIAYTVRGNAYADLDDNQQAIKDFTRAIELNPEYAKAYNNRGKAYYVLQNIQQAIGDFTRAIELNPEAAKTYNNRGIAYGKLENYQQAIKDLTRSIELNPENEVAYYYRGKAYGKLGSRQQAIKDFTRAIELSPEYAKAYNNRGNVYADLGDNQKALYDLDKAIKYNPKNTLAYKARSYVYVRLGDYQQALRDLNKAIEIKPEFAEAYSNRCGIHIQMGNYQRAIKDCSRALEINPQNAMAYNNRGLTFNALGEFDKAVIDYSRAISLNPEDAGFYYNRGTVYLRIGKNNEAIRDFQKSARLGDKKVQELLKKKGIKW